MHMTHAILVEFDPMDLEARSDDELREEAQEQAISETLAYTEIAFDGRRVLTDEEARREGLPSAVVLGRNEADRFYRLLDRWADEPWQQAVALFRGAQGHVLDEQWLKDAWDGETDRRYRIRGAFKALRLAFDEYTFDAGFFSAPDGSLKLSKETRAAVQAHPERFALVFFDDHW
jgi:hypothetical protein